jgi:hypothetical protein
MMWCLEDEVILEDVLWLKKDKKDICVEQEVFLFVSMK